MKRFLMVALFVTMFLNVFSEEGKVKMMEDKLGDYALTLTGEVEAYIKSQDNYTTPFDIPEWSWDTRAGADNREDQQMRVKSTIGVASGIPGQTEFFSYASLKLDANDPDNMKRREDEFLINPSEEKNKVEVDNAFVMWRPLELQGGRPLGIAIGKYGIKATANAAYSNIFTGDFDEDFIAHTATALLGKPMIALDFHTSADTGVGYAYVEGTSDLIKNCSGFADDYSRTHVVWGEGKFGGFGVNAAYQMSEGHRGAYRMLNGWDENTGTYDATRSTADEDFRTNEYDQEMAMLNAQLTYELELGENASIKPFVGYESIWGDEAKNMSTMEIDFDNAEGRTPDVRDIEATVVSGGLAYTQKIGGKKVRFAGEYSQIDSPSFDGLAGLGDGFLDRVVGVDLPNSMGVGIPDFAADPTGATVYNPEDGKFLNITGDKSNAVYTLAGLDAMYHLEMAVEMSRNVTVTLFYNGLISKKVDTAATNEDVAAIKDVLESDMGYNDVTASIVAAEAGMMAGNGINNSAELFAAYGAADPVALGAAFAATGGAPVSTADLAGYLAGEVAKGNDFGTKWTDSESVGISVRYKF